MSRSIFDMGPPGQAVWLDYHAYAAALLAKGKVPWLDQAQYIAFHNTAQSLLHSDVISLPLEPLVEALLEANPDLRAAMKAKSRTSFPLRTLLQNETLRETVNGLLGPLRAAHEQRPLALLMPSPRRWLAGAYLAAHGSPLDPEIASDGDEIDGAAVFLADFLRCFAEAQIDALLLLENPGEAPADATQWAWYDPVINTAGHYRWQVGILDPAPRAPLTLVKGVEFCIAPALAADVPGGLMLDEAFWQAADAPPLGAGQFRYATVPAGATPEMVLQQLAKLH